jgi:3-oxoacyl-[acyl-carrier-protein] synthase-3
MKNVIITGTGTYIPTHIKKNSDFCGERFYDASQEPFEAENREIIEKFHAITGIEERRYMDDDMFNSDMATAASRTAIGDAGIDKESLDYIIVAHNFGDIKKDTIQTNILPSIAARVKYKLGIENPNCIAYDLIFGCPGWVQGLIHARSFIETGLARRVLVVGSESLSRVLDMHDRDSMIYSDGAGAAILEAIEEGQEKVGIIGHASQSHTAREAYYLYLGKSNIKDSDPKIRYIKMHGRKIYNFALTHVPKAMQQALVNSGVDIHDVKKVFIHQANEKMDEAMIVRFFKLFGMEEPPEGIMPMSIDKLGNSSVATVPTLFDLVRKGNKEGHRLVPGDVILFASVGAGMNINAVVYRMPFL